MHDLLLPELLVLALSVPLWVALAVAFSPVRRNHLVAFANRHRIFLTVENGNHLIAYLATTRRWRAFGLALGVIVSVLIGLPALSINSLPLFAGWFLGALIAEVRVLPPPPGRRRVAIVAQRKLSDYLRPAGRALLPVSAGAAAVVSLIDPLRNYGWSLLALAVAATVLLVQRRVLHRPQLAGSPDVIAADDAIRSRSLHVLAGGGTVLVLFLTIGQLTRIGLDPVVAFAGTVLVAVIGWNVAHSRWLVLRAA